MTVVYALATVTGAGLIFGWIVSGAISAGTRGESRIDLDARFGVAGRALVAGVMGFGLAGLSASFAGWSPALSLLAAVGAALGVAGYAAWDAAR